MKVFGNRLLIKPERKKPSEIIQELDKHVADLQGRIYFATVAQLGVGIRLSPDELKIGDRIAYKLMGGMDVEVAGERLRLISAVDVELVLEEVA